MRVSCCKSLSEPVSYRSAVVDPARPVRIAVLEDDPSVCALLERILAASYEVRFVRDGSHLLALVERGLADLVLLDLMLPGEDGLDVGRALRARSNVPVMILSARLESRCIAESLEAFADDYVTKPFPPEVLRSRIQSLLRRTGVGSASSGETGMFDIEIGPCRIEHAERALRVSHSNGIFLTEREYQVLVYLCRRPNRVVTREELSRTVAGRSWDPSDRSLDVHVCNLRKKLANVLPGRRLLRAVRGIGYRLECMPRFVVAQQEPEPA